MSNTEQPQQPQQDSGEFISLVPLPVGNLYYEAQEPGPDVTLYGDREHPEVEDADVPDYMEVKDIAPHIITWFMTGPCITITVTSNIDPSHSETVVVSPGGQDAELGH